MKQTFLGFSFVLICVTVSPVLALGSFNPASEAKVSRWKVDPVAVPSGAYVRRLGEDGKEVDENQVGWIVPALAAQLLNHPLQSPSQFKELEKEKTKLNLLYLEHILIITTPFQKSFRLNSKAQSAYLEQVKKYASGELKCSYLPLFEEAEWSKDPSVAAARRPFIFSVDQMAGADKSNAAMYAAQNCDQIQSAYLKDGGTRHACLGLISCGAQLPIDTCFCDVISMDRNYGKMERDETWTGIGMCPSADECLKQCKNKKSSLGTPIVVDPQPKGLHDSQVIAASHLSEKDKKIIAEDNPLRLGTEKWGLCAYKGKRDLVNIPVTCIEGGMHCPSMRACLAQDCISGEQSYFNTGTGKE